MKKIISKIWRKHKDCKKISLIVHGTKWVYVGDINRMMSQKNRDGGGIILVDDDLHKLFDKLCIKYQK
jgi:hypothetical protein